MIKSLIYNLPPLDKNRPPLSGAIIANVCTKQGHDCSTVDLQFELDQFLHAQCCDVSFFDDVFYEQSAGFNDEQTKLLEKFIHQHLDTLANNKFDYILDPLTAPSLGRPYTQLTMVSNTETWPIFPCLIYPG